MTRNQTLPTAKLEKGLYVLTDEKLTCEPYGQMSDGRLVWSDHRGWQYIKYKFHRDNRYYFVKIGE